MTQIDRIVEARRQIEVCNACRYCEGYCAVFPAINRERVFSDTDVVQLANLCHNCRGCYYACQYTEPHEFALNLPGILAQVRQDSWQRYAYPRGFAQAFQRSGVAIAAVAAVGFALLFILSRTLAANTGGAGFYAVLSHATLVLIFLPAFVLPLFSLTLSLRRYWHDTGGGTLHLADLGAAFAAAARMTNLAGGHGDGCNFEDEDRFSKARLWQHQATMYGFLLCFASTCVATLMHYGFNWQAPYGFWSPPKLLGIPGGVLLSVGTLGLALLKCRAERGLSDPQVYGGEMGFVLLLFFVSTSGLALYAFGDSSALTVLLAMHLGSVLALFLLTPYSKMAHGFYRLLALARDARR